MPSLQPTLSRWKQKTQQTCQRATGLKCHADNAYIGKTILWLYFVDLAFVLVVLLFNIDVYTCYLNSVFFFYQVIGNFLTTTQRTTSIEPVIAMMNFDGFGGSEKTSICLGEWFTDFYKPMLNFAALSVTFVNLAICVWFFSYVRRCLLSPKTHIIVRIFSSVRGCLLKQKNPNRNDDQLPSKGKRLFLYVFQRENGYRATVFIILYTYGSILRVAFDALKFVNIEDHFRMFNYAEFKKGNPAFWWYYTITPFLLILLVMYPCVIDGRLYRKIKQYCCCCLCPDKCCTCKGVKKVVANRHVADIFKEPFRNDCTGFAVYYLAMRIVIDVISMFLVAFNPNKQLSLVILTVVAILILIIFTLNKPYKEVIDGERVYLNQFDTLILFLICAIGIISNGKQKMSVLKKNDHLSPNFVYGVLVQVLLYIPIGCVVVCNIIRFVKFACWAREKRKVAGGWWNFFEKYMHDDPDYMYG